mgnify:CR=1 FL=1
MLVGLTVRALARRLLPEAGSRPGGRGTFLCFAKEKYPKERRPYCACPSAALRATCDARSAGAAAELTARTACAPFGQLRQVRARSACVLRHTHAPAALRFSARTEGLGETAGPLLRSALARGKPSAARSARVPGRAKQWPVCGSPPLLAAPAAGRLRGAHARLRAHASCSDSPRLSERSAQRVVSSAAAPRKRPAAGLPRSECVGVADWGSPFLCLLSFGEAKESECAAGRTSRPREATPQSMPKQPSAATSKLKHPITAPNKPQSPAHPPAPHPTSPPPAPPHRTALSPSR